MTEKLDIGRVFNAIFALYRDNAGILLTTALAIYLGAALLVGVLFLISPILAIFSFIFVFVAQFWYQGVVIELVNRIHAGEARPTVGTLFSAVGPKLGRLIGAGLLAGLGIVIGLILLIVPGLYLLTIWAVISPVIIIEGARVGESFGRSQSLVKGNGWQVFGTVVIIAIVNLVFTQIVQLIFGRDNFLGGLLGTLIPNVLIAPIAALAAAVIYFELRRVKEGAGVPGVPGAVATATPGGMAPPAGGPPPPPPPQ
jgi:hypothetical protein